MRKHFTIRAKDFTTWMKANFTQEELEDIASHGADAGWHHLTYYTDTCHIYEHFKDEIWEALCQDAEDFGHKNPFELIATFGGAVNVGSADQFENLMTWYMAERTARELTE